MALRNSRCRLLHSGNWLWKLVSLSWNRFEVWGNTVTPWPSNTLQKESRPPNQHHHLQCNNKSGVLLVCVEKTFFYACGAVLLLSAPSQIRRDATLNTHMPITMHTGLFNSNFEIRPFHCNNYEILTENELFLWSDKLTNMKSIWPVCNSGLFLTLHSLMWLEKKCK